MLLADLTAALHDSISNSLSTIPIPLRIICHLLYEVLLHVARCLTHAHIHQVEPMFNEYRCVCFLFVCSCLCARVCVLVFVCSCLCVACVDILLHS